MYGVCVTVLRSLPHWSAVCRFLTSRALFAFSGYKLKYVRNITDIDDKIIKRANENGESFVVALVDRMIAEMHQDFGALNILRRTSRVRRHIPGIELTRTLIEGRAYVADNGDVMFDVPTGISDLWALSVGS